MPAADAVISAEQILSSDGKTMFSGMQTIFGTTGSTTPSAIIPGWPNQDTIALFTNPTYPLRPDEDTTLYLTTAGPVGEDVPAGDMVYMEVWDNNGPSPIRQFQAFMYKTGGTTDNGAGLSVHSWEGTIEYGYVFDDLTNYDIYYSDVIDSSATVPEVTWREESAPYQDTQLNAVTMPHVLWRKEDGTFTFGSFNQVPTEAISSWARRTSGDDISNEMPPVIGSPVKDLATFQNRLAILAEDKVSMSVTGQANDFFRGTVTQLLATSPVNVQSTAAEATDLTHFVTHNNDLLVFSPKGQFRFAGDQPLTPSNASFPRASNYPCAVATAPVSAGNDIFFPTNLGAFSSLSQYSLDPQIEGLSVAEPMGDQVVGSMVGDFTQIVASPNLGMVVAVTPVLPGFGGSAMHVLEFEPRKDILKQIEPAWSLWAPDFGFQILSMRMRDDILEMVAFGEQGDFTPRLYRMALQNNKSSTNVFATPFGDTFLDARVYETGVTTTVTLDDNYPEPTSLVKGPNIELRVVQGNSSPFPGAEVPYTRLGQVLTLEDDMLGGDVFVGYVWVDRIELPDFDTRDAGGVIQSRAALRITDVDVTLTGKCVAGVSRTVGDNTVALPTQYWEGARVGTAVTDDVNLQRDTWRVQAKQNSKYLNVVLGTEASHFKCNLHAIEWRGTYHKVGRRF
jgi:hypothetical protein